MKRTARRINKPRNSAYGSYYVLQRDYERKILKLALENAGGKILEAAEALGIKRSHMIDRVRILGGVLPDDPRREPPGILRQTSEYRKIILNYVKSNEKSRNGNHPTKRKSLDADRSADEPEREDLPDDAPRSGDSDGE